MQHSAKMYINCYTMVYTRGLKLKSSRGPHKQSKMFRGPNVTEKMALWDAVLGSGLLMLHILSNMTLFLDLHGFINYVLSQNSIKILTFQ
jgi:hypothetical protein